MVLQIVECISFAIWSIIVVAGIPYCFSSAYSPSHLPVNVHACKYFSVKKSLQSKVLPAEAAEAFRKWRGIGQKGHFCIQPKSNGFMS
jgi:cellobiose-specific phosphotransferase system component IIC